MKKSVCVGFFLLGITTMIAVIIQDMALFYKLSGGIGILTFILSGITIGAFISGDRMRANYQTEDENERVNRVKMATRFFVIGLPNIVAAIVSYTMVH